MMRMIGSWRCEKTPMLLLRRCTSIMRVQSASTVTFLPRFHFLCSQASIGFTQFTYNGAGGTGMDNETGNTVEATMEHDGGTGRTLKREIRWKRRRKIK